MFTELEMRPNILPAFVLCAVILIEARAQDQTSSGFNSYSSGEGSSFESEGSGTTESGGNAAFLNLLLDHLTLKFQSKRIIRHALYTINYVLCVN